eukprot:TRINITY_DN3184_c0_g1_i4.p1 TRINITY_DN3184_c0_g1~~TRINITY_DN3184_c0_g1_i4.p1  ORF type:complete len:128 (-),score=5.46 TRINITY_DN3184_c0_g1_i4:545-928(-)
MGSLEQLQRFSLAGRVGFEGAGNGPKVVLHHPSGASVEVYLHGAHVGLWRTASGRTPIFMSDSVCPFVPPRLYSHPAQLFEVGFHCVGLNLAILVGLCRSTVLLALHCLGSHRFVPHRKGLLESSYG